MYPTDIRPLTALRFGAALWVLVYHFRHHLGLALDRFGPVAKGYLGVDLFFILSGFILAHVYLPLWRERRFSYGSFIWARLARIYPVHLAMLGVMVAFWLIALKLGIAFEPAAFDPAVLPQHVLLIHAWGTTPTDQWNFPSWSISAEWFAYLGFPAAALFVTALAKRPGVALVISGALFIALFLIAQSMGLLFTDLTSQGGAIRIVPSFLTGAALYTLGQRWSLPRLAAWPAVAVAVVWIAAAASLRASDLWIWPALVLLIFALGETAKHGAVGWSGGWLVYLGEASFALYMTHLPVDVLYFHGMERLLPEAISGAPWLVWGGVFLACLVAAIVVHEGIEKPARRFLRRRDPFLRKPPGEPRHEPVI
jgi:peptidoglycan/LPS O-acetylase OafA/YrhL